MPTPRKHPNRAQRQRAYRERQAAARLAEMRAKNMPAGAAVPSMPSTARWKALLNRARECLQAVQAEMESYRDERSESWQEGDRGEAFQERIDRLAEAIDFVEAVG